MSTKPAPRKSTTATKAATKAGLGTFAPNGKPGEVHKCVGECGKRLPVRSFPTTKAAGVRVSECRVCRDKRTKAAKR